MTPGTIARFAPLGDLYDFTLVEVINRDMDFTVVKLIEWPVVYGPIPEWHDKLQPGSSLAVVASDLIIISPLKELAKQAD